MSESRLDRMLVDVVENGRREGIGKVTSHGINIRGLIQEKHG